MKNNHPARCFVLAAWLFWPCRFFVRRSHSRGERFKKAFSADEKSQRKIKGKGNAQKDKKNHSLMGQKQAAPQKRNLKGKIKIAEGKNQRNLRFRV